MRRILRGGLLSYGSFLGSKLVTFASTLVLARLLVPQDFGLVGYALLMLGFLTVLKSVGMGRAMIYRQDLDLDEQGEVFVLSLLFAVTFTAVAWASAPLVADFFHAPRLTLVARLLSLSFILNALGEAHESQLKKRMQFGRWLVPELVFSLVRGAVAVTLALRGVGAFSLVWGQLAGDAVHTLTCWRLFPWRPRLRLRRATAARLLHYGLQVTLLELIALVVINADEVIVGRRLGSAALGIYALAYTLPQILTISLSSAVSVAVFPAFATVQDDLGALRRGYLDVLRWTSLVLAPVGAGLFATAPAFVHTFYTRPWWPMVPVIQALALYGAIFAIGWSSGDVWLAIGRPDLQWKLDGAQMLVVVPTLLAGAALDGITGVAIAQVVAIVPYSAARFWLVHRTLGLHAADLLDRVAVPVAGACAAAAAAIALRSAAGASLDAGILLVLQVAVGVAVYGCAVLRFDRDLRARSLTRLRSAPVVER